MSFLGLWELQGWIDGWRQQAEGEMRPGRNWGSLWKLCSREERRTKRHSELSGESCCCIGSQAKILPGFGIYLSSWAGIGWVFHALHLMRASFPATVLGTGCTVIKEMRDLIWVWSCHWGTQHLAAMVAFKFLFVLFWYVLFFNLSRTGCPGLLSLHALTLC